MKTIIKNNPSGKEPEKRISTAVIKRLPRYYRYLGSLLDHDIKRISSKELSERMGTTASQVRQDLNNFGCFGQQGFGYNVELLYGEIQKILGLDKTYSLIIIGAGNIGQALANYPNFEKRGYIFKAFFDSNPNLIGCSINNLEVYPTDSLESYLSKNPTDIAVLTLPAEAAAGVAKTVFKCGIKGVWNFSHAELNPPKGIIVENVHLTDSLMTLSYKINEN